MADEILTEQPTETAWNAGVAEEHQSAISAFTDTPGLAKGYSELFSKMGTSTSIPTETSTADEKSAFYMKCGRPKTAEGYAVPSMPEGQEVDKEFFGAMTAVAHESGMSSSQFDKMVEKYMGFEAQIKEAQASEFNRYREEADRKLHEAYGADYDKNIELSKRAYTEYAPQELKDLLDTDKFIGLRNEPSFSNMMVDMGKKNMDDTFIKGDGQVEKPKDNYTPASPNSPTMYAMMDGEDGAKARAWFRSNKGFKYDRED